MTFEDGSAIETALALGFILCLVSLAVYYLVKLPLAVMRGRALPAAGVAALDCVLMHWTDRDDLTLRDLLNGGAIVMGRPGSGKSSSSSRILLQACVNYPTSGGLICGSSPADSDLVRRIFAGREERLRVFDERQPLSFNITDFLLRRGASTKDIAVAIDSIAETVNRAGQQGGGEDGGFFAIGAKRIIENAIVPVKHATGKLNPADLLAFINTAASSPHEFAHSEDFKKTFHYQCLRAADLKKKTPVEEFDNDLAFTFFSEELTRMADRTRASLIAVVMNTLHCFNSGHNRLLFATETNIDPTVMDQGNWVFVNMPVSRCGQEGGFALGAWKFATEWHVLRRDCSQPNPPLFVHCDEMHNCLNPYDTRFLGECRKFSGAMIACTQSRASLYATMGGESAKAQVDALLNNFTHKIIHALGDVDTASWVEELLGESIQFSFGGSERSPESMIDELAGHNVWTSSIGEDRRPILFARECMYDMRTGGKINNYFCDALVIRSGELFSNGQGFLRVAFGQKGGR